MARGFLSTVAAAFAASAWTAGAVVCDSQSKVPCFKLTGGAEIPQIAMGTWGGSYKDCGTTKYSCVKQHARYAIETWLRIGGTHIDGANDYRTQTSISEALQSAQPPIKREDIFVTTKCPGAIGYEALMQCADDNLQMLGEFSDSGPGYIDLLLIHFPFTARPVCRFHRTDPQCDGEGAWMPSSKEQLQDTWRAMEDLKKFGVVRSIGVSDYNITQLKQTLETALQPIEVNQVEWNPKHQDKDMLAFCKQQGILLQAWSPLGGSGGSVLGEPPVVKAAAAHNVSTAQVAIRWSLQQGVAVVVGTADPGHAASDLDSFSFTLTDDEMKSISALGGAGTDSVMV